MDVTFGSFNAARNSFCVRIVTVFVAARDVVGGTTPPVSTSAVTMSPANNCVTFLFLIFILLSAISL